MGKQNIHKYIFVLVDGNALRFSDRLLVRGYRGGQTAAKGLRAEIDSFLRSLRPKQGPNEETILVLFADLSRLIADCQDQDWSKRPQILHEFFHGFDSTDVFTYFEEMSNSSNGSFQNLRKTLDILASDSRCQKTLLVGPTWLVLEDYLASVTYERRFLSLRKACKMPCSKIMDAEQAMSTPSLIATPGSLPTSSISESGFESVQHQKVGGYLLNGSRITSTFELKLGKPCWTQEWWVHSGPLSSLDTAYARNQGDQHLDSRSPLRYEMKREGEISDDCELHTQDGLSPAVTTIDWWAEGVCKNQAGQRIDPEIDFRPAKRYELQKEGYCNNFHLKGRCTFGDACRHKHGQLTNEYLDALKTLARGSPCRYGNACPIKDCYAGHHCPFRPCLKKPGECYYPKEMHIHDRTVVLVETGSSDSGEDLPSSIPNIIRKKGVFPKKRRGGKNLAATQEMGRKGS